MHKHQSFLTFGNGKAKAARWVLPVAPPLLLRVNYEIVVCEPLSSRYKLRFR
jgi:hypothetical protein